MSKRIVAGHSDFTLNPDGSVSFPNDINMQSLRTVDGVDVSSLLALNEPTGFPNRTGSAVSFVSGTRTFSIAPSNGSFVYYIAGVVYTVSSSDDIIIAATSGLHVIYYDGATLSEVVNPSTSVFDDLMHTKALAGLVYWNNTNTTAYVLADERHGTVMSGETHHWLHDNLGARWRSGLTASGYTLSTKSDAALKFDVTNGEFFDEDIELDITNGTASNQYEQVLQGDAEIPVLYRDGDPGYWKEQSASTLPYINAGDNQNLAYNSLSGSTWGQTACDNTKFVVYTLILTNDWQYPIKMVQGNTQYANKSAAIEGIQTEMTAWGSLPSLEFAILYRFVMQTGVYAGVKNAQIIEVTDFRAAQIVGTSALAQDHGTLSGLADDDHAQYILADGTRALSGAWDMGSQNLTNVNIDSGTIGGVTLDGTITIDGQVFDAGSGSLRINTTGAGEGIDIYSTNEGSGVRLSFYHVTASPVADDIPFQWYIYGKDTGGTQRELAIQRFLVESVTGATLAGKMDIYLRTGSAWNQALTLSSAGALWIDAGLTIGGTLTGVTTLTATNISVLNLDLGTESAEGIFSAELTALNAGTAWLIRSRDTIDTYRPRLSLSGGVDIAVWAWTNSTHTGIKLSGALDANSNLINNVTDPSDPQDAATKQYVDNNAGGITQAQVLARVSLRG